VGVKGNAADANGGAFQTLLAEAARRAADQTGTGTGAAAAAAAAARGRGGDETVARGDGGKKRPGKKTTTKRSRGGGIGRAGAAGVLWACGKLEVTPRPGDANALVERLLCDDDGDSDGDCDGGAGGAEALEPQALVHGVWGVARMDGVTVRDETTSRASSLEDVLFSPRDPRGFSFGFSSPKPSLSLSSRRRSGPVRRRDA